MNYGRFLGGKTPEECWISSDFSFSGHESRKGRDAISYEIV